MKTYSIPGTYGSYRTPCRVHCAERRDGATWYAVHGSQNVNLSPGPLSPGVDVETIPDVDAFTWPDGIRDETELAIAVLA